MNVLENISAYNFVEIDGYAYFSNMFYNALFKVEIRTGKTTFLGSFACEKLSDTNIHFEIIKKKGQIFFFPRMGRHMHIYHLDDQTMQTIEVRKESDPFYWIEEVVLNDDFIYLLPKQISVPIKKIEWDTYRITDLNNKLTIQGRYLSRYRKTIPAKIVDKYQIKYGKIVSCKQRPDKKWYCFKPIGRQILYFEDEIKNDNLENIALSVMNEVELKEYLYKVKQNLFRSKIRFSEAEGFKLKEILKVATIPDKIKWNYYLEENEDSFGKTIWKKIEEI